MPSPNPTTTREFRGAAKSTTLSAQIVNGSDTTFTIADSTGWPTGGTGKFVVAINAGQSDEEKILCLSRTGTTVTVDTRGFDSTTAAAHAANATAQHTISAFDAAEWNAHTAATSGVHGVAGAVVGTTDAQVLTTKTVNLGSNTVTGTTAQFNTALSDNDFATLAGSETLTNKTLTAPAVSSPALSGTATGSLAGFTGTGASLDAASTHGGVSGTSLAADRTAWTTYTPTFTNCSLPTGNFAYKLIGKTLHLRAQFTGGTVTSTAAISFSLPGGVTAVTGPDQLVSGRLWGSASNMAVLTVGSGTTTVVSTSATSGTQLSQLNPMAGVIEVA